MKQFFDFKKGKEFNPAKTLEKFFINPYMADNARLLGLEKKSLENLGNDFSFIWYKGVPVAVFPIDILNLGKCLIEWKDLNSGTIRSEHRKIYFVVTEDNTVRFDTIL